MPVTATMARMIAFAAAARAGGRLGDEGRLTREDEPSRRFAP